jgi:hypothetical protein
MAFMFGICHTPEPLNPLPPRGGILEDDRGTNAQAESRVAKLSNGTPEDAKRSTD